MKSDNELKPGVEVGSWKMDAGVTADGWKRKYADALVQAEKERDKWRSMATAFAAVTANRKLYSPP